MARYNRPTSNPAFAPVFGANPKDEWVYLLLREVIIQAVQDYRDRLHGPHAAEPTEENLGLWFRSDWGDALCLGQGEYIASRIEREVRR